MKAVHGFGGKLGTVGAWRSLVAHSLGVRVVGRSNRLAPTTSDGVDRCGG